ncbi:MAG TPA: efflux RND transporter periplasmic adaptor subunit [Bryobacteraceae bacterium]|nr:efflux RND transporter periplasmic adaptor subunit [Bryobacteraceae bacterium]
MKRIAFLMICALAMVSCSKPKIAPASEERAEAPKAGAGEREKEESKGQAGTVEISPEAQQRSGIVVEPAATAPMTQQLQATGTVQASDSSIAHIRPLTRGRLLDVLVKVGDRVVANQALAQLDNIEAGEILTQYNSAQAELQRLKIQLAAQQRQVERYRRLVEIGAAPQKDYEFSLAEQQGLQEGIRAQESAIAGLRARLGRFGITDPASDAAAMTAIRAPFAGVIIRSAAAPGDVVEAGAELFSVADLSTVYVQAQVYEKDLGQVRVGQAAAITVDSYPGERFTGRVASISDLIDPQTRTASVRCQVANPGARLKLEMLAMVQFPTSTKRAVLAVPADAIQTIDDKPVVFVQTSASSFSVRGVDIGSASQGRVEIIRGLKEGEPVVSKGAFAVKSVLLGKELQEEKE